MRAAATLALCVALLLPATAAASPAGAKPDIAGTTLNGTKLSLKWYRGKWVFINAWASW